MVFSKSIEIADSNSAEYFAIKEAFTIFSASKWMSSHGLIVESDSINAVKWFNCHDLIPWKLKKFYPAIESLKRVVLE
ncbi:hypothetical protein REPUB_Repub11eG0064600 [Reevesia pubescens]